MIEYNGIRWGFYNKMLIPLAGPHVDTGMNKRVAETLVAKYRALLMRWVSDFDCQSTTEWWYVIKDGKSSLEELSRNARHDVRRGQKRCYVSRLEADFIAYNAYPVYKAAFLKYKTRKKLLSEAQFTNSFLRNPRKDLSDYWGVFDQGSKKLIGYCKNRYLNGGCEYLTGQFDPDYLKNYSSTVLIYEMDCYYLNELGALYVSDGQRTISHDTNIQEFLIHKLGFRKAYCRLNIVYHPVVKVLVNALYPLRSLVSRLDENIYTLFKQEEIRRSLG